MRLPILALILALPRLLSCGGCDSEGGSSPEAGFEPLPHFVVVADGDGAASEASLWPLRVGARFGQAVCEGKTTRDGVELLRYVYSEQNFESVPDERPERVSWYSRPELGLTFHGSTLGGFLVHPVLFVPAEVRLGMSWETGSPDAPLTFEVSERVVEETMWGSRTVWSIRSVAGDQVVRFAEGFGPIDERTGDGASAQIMRAFLPADDQPGIDVEWGAGAEPTPIQTVDSDGAATGDLEYGGSDDPVSLVSGHVLTGHTPILQLHQREGGACFEVRPGADRSGARLDDTAGFGELEATDCPLSTIFAAGTRSLVAPVSHAGAAVPVDGKVYYAHSLPRAVVGLPDVSADASFLTTLLGADGAPQRLGHFEATESSHRDRRTRALRLYGLDDSVSASRIANAWLAVDQVNHFVGNAYSDDGRPALTLSGPRHVLAHTFGVGDGPVPITLIGLSGTVLSSSFDGAEVSRPELQFFKAGNPNTGLFDEHRELLFTTADGLVHRVETAADGGRRLVRVAEVDVPSRQSLVGVFRPTAGDPGADQPFVAVTASRAASCDDDGSCTRTRRLYWVPGIAPVVDQSPRSLDISAVRDGLDVLVCWPRELGPPGAATGWRLAGAEPAAVVEEPDGVGSCVLLVRDLSATVDLTAAGLFHVEATMPGVGAMQMAAVLAPTVFPEGLGSYAFDHGTGPHALGAGGFATLSGVYGRSGALLGQAVEAAGDEGAEVRDFAGAGVWRLTSGGTAAEPTSTFTLLGGETAAHFELDYASVQVPTARGGVLSCDVVSSTEQRCEQLFADGSSAPRADIEALDRRTHGLPRVELGDGTLCGERTVEGPPVEVRTWCLTADGVEIEAEPMLLGTVVFPVESGWFSFEPDTPGVRYIDATTLTTRELDPRCALRPTLDDAGNVWAMLVDDSAAGCDAAGSLLLARLGTDEVATFAVPQPSDVYGAGSSFGSFAVGSDVIVVLTAPGEREPSELGAGVSDVGPSVYRLPRSIAP